MKLVNDDTYGEEPAQYALRPYQRLEDFRRACKYLKLIG
jgi:hypothetical protein